MAETSREEKNQLTEKASCSRLPVSSLQDTNSVEAKVIPETYEMMSNLRGIYVTPSNIRTSTGDYLNSLHEALYNNDYDTFENIVKQQPQLLDHVYGYPDYKSCLEIAVSQPGREKFIKLILKYQVNVNNHNKTYHAAPIHFAIENGNLLSLKVLMEYINLDINNKKDGNTPLLQAIIQMQDTRELAKLPIYEEIIQLLLEKGCNLNTPNSKGVTPIYAASIQGSYKVVTLLLRYSKIKKEPIDLDTYHDRRGKSARDIIREKMPNMYKILNTDRPSEVPANNIDRLFSYLYKHEEDNFIHAFTEIRDNLEFVFTANNGEDTMLTLATKKGLEKVVDILLSKGANPNDTYNTSRPIAIACRNGYLEILKKYLTYNASIQPDNGDSLIQITIKEMTSELNDPKTNYQECLKVLLATKKIDINHRDGKNNTALHYAARNGDNDIVLLLLKNGACIGLKNKFNEPPVADINIKTLETYMNDCIKIDSINDENAEIKINYSFLSHENNTLRKKKDNGENGVDRFIINTESSSSVANPCKEMYESEVLLYMAKKERYKHLLLHPVISSFLYLKWQRISFILYAHTIFYALMYILLILHILLGYNGDKTQTDKTDVINILTRCGSILGLCFLLLRELIQFLLTPESYLKRKQNWVELILIVVIVYIVCLESAKEGTKKLLSVVAILLSSVEIVMLLSNFPTPSTYFVMLKKVTKNFIKLIMWYSILIIAFALSFFILFRPTAKDNRQMAKKNETNFFENSGLAIFKTIVMITGEFETGNINFDASPGTSHILFIIFIFIVPIILFNLLNGLAVNDIYKIREDAKIVRQILLIEICLYFEKIFVGTSVNNVKYLKFKLPIVNDIVKRINLFPDFVPQYKIILKTTDNNIIVDIPGLESTPTRCKWCCFTKCRNYRMKSKIIQAAKTIHSNKSEFDTIKEYLEQNEKQLNKLKVSLEELSKQIEKIREIKQG